MKIHSFPASLRLWGPSCSAIKQGRHTSTNESLPSPRQPRTKNQRPCSLPVYQSTKYSQAIILVLPLPSRLNSIPARLPSVHLNCNIPVSTIPAIILYHYPFQQPSMFLPGYEGAVNAFKQRRYEGDTCREEYDGIAALLVNPRVLMKILIARMRWIPRVSYVFCRDVRLAHACNIYVSADV